MNEHDEAYLPASQDAAPTVQLHGSYGSMTFRMLYQIARSVYDTEITRWDMNFMVHWLETDLFKK